LLEYFFGQTDLRFAAYAFTSVKNIDWPNDPVIGEIRYHDVYHKLVIENVRRDQNLVITLKLRTTTGEDKHLHSYLHKELRRLVAIRVVRGYENDLTQFADLLVGCIYGDMLRPESHIKLNLIRELKARLSVQSLWDKSLSKRGGFRVTVVDR